MQLISHGYAAVELTTDETTILVDPFIAENPHCGHEVRDFEHVDTILVTHGADDHLGDAAEIARTSGATIHSDFASFIHLLDEDLPSDSVNGYIWGMEIRKSDWSAKVVEAHHLSMFWREGLIGPALGFMISLDDQVVYHMGDTSIFGDIDLFGDLYDPTISLVPVGEFEGFLAELHPDEAALVAEWLDSETVIPIHYPPESENPLRFREFCEDRGVDEGSDVVVVDPCEPLEF